MKQNNMLAMILAGGTGSRLHELTNKVAKPAVSYGGKYRIIDFKRFKDDVKEVKAGYECGLVFEKFNDIVEGDQVEAYIMVEVPR